MREIPISRFKAACVSVLDDVRKTGKPVRITRSGRPVADVMPTPIAVPASKKSKSWLGCAKGTGEILGDIVGPIYAFERWTADEE